MKSSRSTNNETHSTVRLTVMIVLAVWLAVVLLLGANGGFVRPPEKPPFPILFGATVPLVVFVVAYLLWGAFRAYMLTSDS